MAVITTDNPVALKKLKLKKKNLSLKNVLKMK